MTIWFTADTHFGHENIIKYCNRPFSTVKEMDAEIVRRWNTVVSHDDIVYHLGDFCANGSEMIRFRLNGQITFIQGDHDRNIRGALLKDHIHIIDPLQDEYGNPRKIVLCHYAMHSWPLSHYASWHLFGHHHGKLEPHGLSFDVGVDCWDFAPVSLEEVAEKMKTLSPIVDYRK
jgi:calcineurin-like phosphoesterase family protein